MAKGMNVELSAQNIYLISTTQHAPATNLIPYAGTRKPVFVHVQNKPAPMDTSCSTSEGNHDDIAYIYTLYVHATDCIGTTFIVPTTTLADWTTQSTCRVFISGSNQLSESTLSTATGEKRKFSLLYETWINHFTQPNEFSC
jgi:hypothetical protein